MTFFKNTHKNYSKCLFILFFLSSCDTLAVIPEKLFGVGSTTVDYVTSVFTSDDELEIDKQSSKKEINESLESPKMSAGENIPDKKKTDASDSLKENNEIDDDFTVSDSQQKLEVNKPEVLTTQTLSDTEMNDAESLEVTQENEQVTIKDNDTEPEMPIGTLPQIQTNDQMLVLSNKIQFKIATINFSSGSSIVSAKGKTKIMKVLKLAKTKNATVKIVGHASTRTKDMDIISHKLVNFKISDQRAQSVASVFVNNKFPLERLITEAVSDSKPLFHEVMPAGTNANQRTEIFLIY